MIAQSAMHWNDGRLASGDDGCLGAGTEVSQYGSTKQQYKLGENHLNIVVIVAFIDSAVSLDIVCTRLVHPQKNLLYS